MEINWPIVDEAGAGAGVGWVAARPEMMVNGVAIAVRHSRQRPVWSPRAITAG
jgi:hypothetical protein